MSEFQRIVPSTSKKLEIDLDRMGHNIVDQVPIPLRTLDKPYEIDYDLLPWLAWGRSVDIWDERWPEWKKRSVIAEAYNDHAMKGTLAGLLRYLDIMDASLVQIVRPPQGYFALGTIPKAQLDDYIQQHPKVRVTLQSGRGTWEEPHGWYAGEGFVDETHTKVDDGPAMWGRRAYLVKDGFESPLQVVTYEDTAGYKKGVIREEIYVPGLAGGAWIAGEGAAGVDYMADWAIPAIAYSYSIDHQYKHVDSRVQLGTVGVGYAARDTKYYRESIAGVGLDTFFCNDYAGEGYVVPSDAAYLLADVLYLHDPEIAALQTQAMSFAGVTRAAMPKHYAEVQVDWRQTMPEHLCYFAGESFGDEDPIANNDTSRRRSILDAIQLSKRLSDKIRVTFQLRRARTLGDANVLDGSITLGDSVRNIL